MDSYTTEQLLMCEKADLVKYIEELREQVTTSKDDIIKMYYQLVKLTNLPEATVVDISGQTILPESVDVGGLDILDQQ